MQQRKSLVVLTLVAAFLAAGGALGQDVPEEPEAPPPAEAPQAPEAPEVAEAPEPAEGAEPVEEAASPVAPSVAFETSVAFEPMKKIAFEGRAGEVALRGVEFTVSQAKGGVLGTSDADLKAVISVLLECATDADKKAKLEVTVFFLDAEGNVIDRTSESFGLKAGSKIVEIKTTTLKYVVPLIETVKLSAVAKK